MQAGVASDTPSYFPHQQDRPSIPDEEEVSKDKAKPPPKGLCKWLGKTPWVRKGTQPRIQTNTATTSSSSLADTRIDRSSSKGAAGGFDRLNHGAGKCFFPRHED